MAELSRGIIILAQNSIDRVARLIPNHVLDKQYKGIHVDIWYPNLNYIKGQHVWYNGAVYIFTKTVVRNKEFNKENTKMIVDNVKIHYDKNDLIEHHICKAKDLVLSNNNLYVVKFTDDEELYNMTHEYVDISVDVWYKELEHLSGQHVWYNNRVWKANIDIQSNVEFNENDYTQIIDQDVFLYNDMNTSLTFINPRPGSLVLNNNNICFIKPVLVTDYIKQSILLAMTLRNTNPEEKISIITDAPIDEEYVHLFDKIIPIPFGDDAETAIWKVENRWKIYHCSPYERTIVMDTDMMIFDNLEPTWEVLEDFDLFFTSQVKQFNGLTITNDSYRKAFTNNNLPNTYVGVHYFKKSQLAKNFYNMLEIICKNWKEFYKEFLPINTPPFLSIDVSAALAVKILNIEDEVMNTKTDVLTFTHMKSQIQGWDAGVDRWQDKLGVYLANDCTLKLGNFLQKGILHYTEKDFCNKVFDKYKECSNV
jgi:hypothetical protein